MIIFFSFIIIVVLWNHTSESSRRDPRLLTLSCHAIDRYISWNFAKDCYFYLLSPPSPRTISLFESYFERVVTFYIRPRVTVSFNHSTQTLVEHPNLDLDSDFNLIPMEVTPPHRSPMSLPECLRKISPLDDTDNISGLLQFGFQTSALNELNCLKHVTLLRMALNLFRSDLCWCFLSF